MTSKSPGNMNWGAVPLQRDDHMTETIEVSGTVPLAVSTSTALVVGSRRTLSTLFTTMGLSVCVLPSTVAVTPMVYVPAAAVAPVLVAPFHRNDVRPVSAGVSLDL